MAHYSYKDIANRIPQKYIDEIEDFDYDANYDGHYWIAVNNWVNDLQDEIKSFHYPHPQSLRAEVIRLRKALEEIIKQAEESFNYEMGGRPEVEDLIDDVKFETWMRIMK